MSRIVSAVGIATRKNPQSQNIREAMETAVLNAKQQGIEDQAEIRRLMNIARVRIGGKTRVAAVVGAAGLNES